MRESSVIELRFDYLSSAAEVERAIRAVDPLLKPRSARSHRGARTISKATVIATLRRCNAGGEFRGTVSDQQKLLAAAIRAGCSWCDLEVESAEASPDTVRTLQVAGGRVVISFHDFRRTPEDLISITRRLRRCGGDAIKVAAHCATLSDALRILALSRDRDDVVAVPMGEAGLPARVLALGRGSALAYASSGEATAPGQLGVSDMRNIYRASKITRSTRIFGIVGDPVKYSQSPLMHNSGYVERGVNAVFLPFQVTDLRDFMRSVSQLRLAGLSVTKPHKQSILPYLHRCEALSSRIGAINTVAFRGKQLFGYNTDYIGVLRALQPRLRLRGSRILILGAGGAARAAAFALAHAGADVVICARRAARARELADASCASVIQRSELRREKFDAIINATPVGMGADARSPLRANELNSRVVMDMVYSPIQTPLLRAAARRGIKTISGAEMFIAQGAAQWEIWLRTRAPVKVMRHAVLRALASDERRSRPHSRKKSANRK